MLKFALKNMLVRRARLVLVTLSIVLSASVALLSFNISQQVNEGIISTAGYYDLIIGPAGSSTQLAMNTMFFTDEPLGTISYEYVEELEKSGLTNAVVPFTMGDSFNGAKIVGTSADYLEGKKVKEGKMFEETFEAVVGSAVAERYKLEIGDSMVTSHGLTGTGHSHESTPLIVSGILAKTGTAYDNVIFTACETVWAVHDHGDHDHSEEEHAEDEEHVHTEDCDHSDEEHAEEEHVHTEDCDHSDEEHAGEEHVHTEDCDHSDEEHAEDEEHVHTEDCDHSDEEHAGEEHVHTEDCDHSDEEHAEEEHVHTEDCDHSDEEHAEEEHVHTEDCDHSDEASSESNTAAMSHGAPAAHGTGEDAAEEEAAQEEHAEEEEHDHDHEHHHGDVCAILVKSKSFNDYYTLTEVYGANADLLCINPSTVLREVLEQVDLSTQIVYILCAIILLMNIVVISVITLLNMYDAQKEIALMRLIGVSMRRIGQLYLIQNGIIGLIATILALLLSHACLGLMSSFVASMGIVLNITAVYPLEWAIMAVVFVLSVLPTMIRILSMSRKDSISI